MVSAMHLGDARRDTADGTLRIMPHHTAPPAIDPGAAAILTPQPDRRAGQFSLLIRAVGLAILPVDAIEILVGLAYGEWRATVLGVLSTMFALWLIRLSWQPERLGAESTITRLATATLGLIAAAAILEPAVAVAMAIAALLPGVLVLPFLRSAAVGRILAVVGVVGIGSVVAGQVVPPSDVLPSEVTGALAFVTVVLAYGFLLLFMWEVSRRLKGTTDDLRSVVALSNDLSRTTDPQLVGNQITQHIALAVGARETALCYWDRATDRLVTMGCYPSERAASLEPWYPLADYPATRRVLETTVPLIVDAADPAADPSEVAYLASIGMRSMAMVPLITAGTAVGTIELMSERSGAFGARDVEMASMLATEGAMALENARLYQEIQHQALHDGLTGLANRVLFRDRVANAIQRSLGRDGHPFAVLFIDLDDFKTLNDTLGHARGDDILVATARRVADSLRPNDTAARLGGDEFAVLLDGIVDDRTALSIAVRLADALREPMSINGATITVAASIGVALSGAFGETADDLLRNADVAMYAAKASSRGRAQVFQSMLRADAVARGELASLLRGVETRDELRLDYQPIVELASGAVIGLEALVRWQPPDRPLQMPDKFIDLAEQTGDIVPMGRWILREACRQVRAWQVRLGLPDLQVSVNLSARQFQEHDLVETVRQVLAETELKPSSLVLEITESGLMQRTTGTIGRLAELRSLGIHLAIDDFGTGYSSLSYLERFPVDSLKIDRSFISELTPNGERPAIARAIVELGRTLGLHVVAEGIEQPDQADWLVSLGCGYGQGYLFSRPLGVDATEAYLSADASRRAQAATYDNDAGLGTSGRSKPLRRRSARTLRLVSGE
jgi:diguanylate cyclase (GGDEF)-like protein